MRFNNWAIVEETRKGWKTLGENGRPGITEHSWKRSEDLAI